MLAVRDQAPGELKATTDKFVVELGKKADIPLKLKRGSQEFKGNFQVTPAQPPDTPPGITFGAVTFPPGKDEQKLALTVGANTTPGTYNLVFRGFAQIAPKAKGKSINTILPSNAVQVVVLPKQVAKLSLDNANPKLKAGAEMAITVKVQRLFDYADAFTVELVLPQNAKGLTADKITIAPGANEAKLTLRVPPGTPPANLQNLVVRAVAVLHGNVNLTHETKINVSIVK